MLKFSSIIIASLVGSSTLSLLYSARHGPSPLTTIEVSTNKKNKQKQKHTIFYHIGFVFMCSFRTFHKIFGGENEKNILVEQIVVCTASVLENIVHKCCSFCPQVNILVYKSLLNCTKQTSLVV